MIVKDKDLTESLASDPFHTGLHENDEFKGFDEAERRPQDPMSDEEIKASRSKLARLVRNPQLLLVLTYVGTLLLMAKVYA